VMKAELMDWLKVETNHKRHKEDLSMIMEDYKKIMEESEGDPIHSILVSYGDEQEIFNKLKREIQSLMLDKD